MSDEGKKIRGGIGRIVTNKYVVDEALELRILESNVERLLLSFIVAGGVLIALALLW